MTDQLMLILTILLGAYALGVAAFLALENRSPQSTFAWLLLLLLFPIAGLVIYDMFGRGRHAFSRTKKLAKLWQDSSLAKRSAQVMAEQPGRIAGLGHAHYMYGRLAGLLWNSGRAPVTVHNQCEILQDAREKYPRLIQDMHA